MATIGGSNIATDGLVLALDAANTKSYPGSGTTWTDISGNNNNGLSTGGPTFNSANNGSIVFNGSNQYVTLGNLNVGNTISVFSWFKSTTSNSETRVIVSKVNSGFTTGWELENSSGTLRATLRPSVSFNNDVLGGNIILESWNYGGFTCDNTTINLYLNSILVSTTSASAITLDSVENVLIGRRTAGQYFLGSISNVKIYNRALSASEVLQNYNGQKSRYNL